MSAPRAALRGAAVLGAAALLLPGCGAVRAPLGLPETPPVEGPWPRLVDAPEFGAAGTEAARSAGAPDPAAGRAVAEELSVDAAAGAAEAERLAAPVVSPAESARLRTAARR